jgi:glycosyltransferase involved in cell wall biosynthesis
MQIPLLTIGIPTYNRPSRILRTVEHLVKQIRPGVEILIVDNCSTNTNVEEHLRTSLPQFESYPIRVVRNKVNIGPDANYARCFEHADGEYMWTLSDDDMVMDDAIDTIIQEIEKYKHLDLIGFNFNSNCNLVERSQPILINNINDLSNKLDFFGNWLFMSTNVYKTREYFQYLRFAFWGAYTMASQLVPPMVAISKNKAFILSEKTVVNNTPPENLDEVWSGVKLSFVITILLEAPVNFKDNYMAFGRKLAVQQIATVSAPVYAMLKSINNDVSLIDNYHIYVFKQHFYRTVEFRPNKFKSFLNFWFWLFILKNKSILRLWMRFFKNRFKKREVYFNKFDLLIR